MRIKLSSELLNIGLAVAPAGLAKALPQLLQQHMQALAAGEQMQIEQQGDQGTFEVIADLLVIAVGIAAIQLHPGFCGALQQALHLPAGGGEKAAEIFGEILEVLLLAAESCLQNDELVVVARDPLGKPQLRNQDRLAVAIRA